MSKKNQDELVTDAINNLTEKVSTLLLQEFLKLPEELQVTVVLVKSAQLLLANVLCQVAEDRKELEVLIAEQNDEVKELTLNCAFSGYMHKFEVNKH